MLILEINKFPSCGPSWFLKIILFLREFLNILYIAIPICLIILMMIDLSKAVISSDDDKMTKSAQMAIKRLKYAILIFAVPWIVSVVMSILGDIGVEYTSCLNITQAQVGVIEQREEKEEEEYYQELKNNLNNNSNSNSNNNSNNNSNSNSNNNSNSNSNSNSNNNGNSSTPNVDFIKINKKGCDGVVYFENGTFYVPKFSSIPAGTDGTQGSGPNNYNKYFYELLQQFLNDAKKAGFTITASTTLMGSWRPYEVQAYYYCCYTGTGAPYSVPQKYRIGKYANLPTCTGAGSCNGGNRAAKPGISYHGYGIAADLGGVSNNTAASNWAKNNASKYHLVFGVPGEPWHIQPLKVVVGDNKGCTSTKSSQKKNSNNNKKNKDVTK